ncbi:MAG TPA: methyltransferase domain-containing protein [Candidatus Acidoferrum sp.]|nr:methyltransferase domain-containing protein [Candidatus Acidoferrum sp.]
MNNTYKGSTDLLRDFWENRSVSFEKDYSIRQEGIVKLTEKIAELIEGKNVLELGCGPGIIASYYPQTSDLVGIDFSSSMLKLAKERVRNLVLGDALNLPFRNRIFEVLTCFFIASDYAAKENIFAEAFRVLKVSGVFLYADYSPEDEHWKLRRQIQPALGQSCDIKIEKEGELLEKLKKTGFSLDEPKLIRFNAEFRLERYLKSQNEIQKLKEANPDLWETLKTRLKKGKIEREFILLISRK